MKKVAIIIVNWNGKRLLKNCLSSVFEQGYKNFDVYFVDNGSVDGSVEYVQKNFPKIKIIRLKKNTGFAMGNNVGILRAFEDSEVRYIVCLNNDTKVNKNWLKELVKITDRKEKIGMVASKSFFSDGKIQNVGLYIASDDLKSSGGISRGFDEDPSKFNKEEEIFASSGCSALYKREMLEEIGLFDGDFFAYSEDSDLGFRAQSAGWKAIYNPKSQLIHYHSKTSGGAGSPMKAFFVKRNGFFEALKNYSWEDFFKYVINDFKTYFSYLKVGKKNKSVTNLKNTVGIFGVILIIFKIYGSILWNFPKMFRKRLIIQQNRKITKAEYKDLFIKFSK